MRVAILAPGPGLERYKDDGYGLRIGVNRAVTRFACDWWAALDYQTIGEVTPCGWPMVFTTAESVAALARRGVTLDGYLTFEELVTDISRDTRWPMYSATAAIALAQSLGASSIDVWGAPMIGESDFDGTTGLRNNRSRERWALERRIVACLFHWLRKHRIEIKRR